MFGLLMCTQKLSLTHGMLINICVELNEGHFTIPFVFFSRKIIFIILVLTLAHHFIYTSLFLLTFY